MVRQRIKNFAATKVTLKPGRHKVVILDEADSMTEGAQQALRRIMEVYSSTTRFAFACNQSDKIIEPLQSRCAIVKFAKLSDKDMLRRILYVCEQEKVEYDEEGLQALLFTSQGDMRQARALDFVWKDCPTRHYSTKTVISGPQQPPVHRGGLRPRNERFRLPDLRRTTPGQVAQDA